MPPELTMYGSAEPPREELELDQIRADIVRKQVQARSEPWDARAAAFYAGATAMLAVAIHILSHLH